MSSIAENKVKLGNIICVVVALILLILQFTPFWTVPETGERVSIGSYVGFPQENADLESYLKAEVGEDYSINGVVLGPVAIIALGAVGIVLCLIKPGTAAFALIPAAAGAVGAWGYPQAALKLGSGWSLHLILCILLIAAAALTIAAGVKEASN